MQIIPIVSVIEQKDKKCKHEDDVRLNDEMHVSSTKKLAGTTLIGRLYVKWRIKG